MSRTKRVSKIVLTVMFGILVASLISEGVLRIYNPFDFRVKGDRIILPINVRYEMELENNEGGKLDNKVIHTKNSIGFRGEEPPLNFDEYLTIVAVGGSTTESFLQSDGKTWPDLLGEMLKKQIDRTWINNAGFDGFSTFGHLVLMEDYIAKIKPDIVLFLIGANDKGVALPREYDRKYARFGFLSFSSFNSFIVSLSYYSEIVDLMVNMQRALRARNMGVTHRNVNLEAAAEVSKPVTLSAEYGNQVLEEHRITYLPAYRERIKELIKISRKNGIEPVFITQPTLYGKEGDSSGTILEWQVLELYNAVLRDLIESESILVIDLARELPKDSKYFYDSLHYSNEGSQKIAEILSAALFPHILTHNLN